MKKLQPPVFVLFDGECPFCIRWVRWIAKTGRVNSIFFVPGKSEAGEWLVKRFSLAGLIDKTIIVISDEQVYIKSEAVCALLNLRGGLWKAFAVFCLFPRRWLDGIYLAVAAHRQHLSRNN
ncbi:MAG: hypothetical protein CVU06_16515, partial [Bacteroidetes bacterium HGW-Bacteroidetes-22]